MGILAPFIHPQDTRWRTGPQRHHHTIFLAKNLLLIPFIILVIVEFAVFKSSWKWDIEVYAPYNFWLRIGLALIPDLIYTIASIFLILNSMHHAVYSFHPVFALVGSVLLVCLYIQVCWLAPFLAYANEDGFSGRDAWEKMVYAEAGFEVVLCFLWVGMMACSAAAVHKWRKTRKSGGQEERV